MEDEFPKIGASGELGEEVAEIVNLLVLQVECEGVLVFGAQKG